MTTNNKLSILLCFVSIIFLFSACNKNDFSNETGTSTSSLNINAVSVNENESTIKSEQVPTENTKTTAVGDGLSLISSISTNSGSKTKAATALADSVKYRVIIYDNSGNWVASRQFSVGSVNTSANRFELVPGKYTVICYSFNATSDLPFDGKTGSILTNIAGNTDLLYYSTPVTTTAHNANTLNISFAHKFSRVRFVINSYIGNITTFSGATISPYCATGNSMDLKTGTVTKSSTTSTGSFTIPTTPKGITTDTLSGIFCLPSGATSTLTVNTLTVNGTTKKNINLNYTIAAGQSYTITWTITGLSAYGSTWAPGNLIYNRTTGVYGFTTTNDAYGDYWFPDYLLPRILDSDWHYQKPNSTTNGGSGDPCKQVIPVNTWRLPTVDEITNPHTSTPQGSGTYDSSQPNRYSATNYNSSDTSTNPGLFYGTQTDPGANRGNYLFVPYGGNCFTSFPPSNLDGMGYYLCYDTTNGYEQVQIGNTWTFNTTNKNITNNAMSIRCVMANP